MNRWMLLFVTLFPAFVLAETYPGNGDDDTEINMLLNYPEDYRSEISLPPGSSFIDFIVQYGEHIDKTNLVVELNSHDISGRFGPKPRHGETVRLELVRGHNLLRLRVPEKLPGSAETPRWDYDTFDLFVEGGAARLQLRGSSGVQP